MMRTMRLIAEIAVVVTLLLQAHAFRPLSRSPKLKQISGRRQQDVSMTYEILHEITPHFAGQLAACGSIITAGVTLMNKPHKSSHLSADKLEEYDVFRDSPLRYAGYLNEMGEAFRPLVPVAVVIFSYILTFSYVFADAVSKGHKYGELNADKFPGSSNPAGPLALFDTLGFQTIASVAFPGFIINRWVTLCAYMGLYKYDLAAVMEQHGLDTVNLAGHTFTAEAIASGMPTVLGLALIPFIVKPLDELTEFILDHTIRYYIAKHFPACELPFDMQQLEDL